MKARRKFIEQLMIGGIGGIVTTGFAPVNIKDLKWLKESISLKEAQELHNQCLIFDSHNDTPVERVARGEKVSTMLQMDKDYQTDVPRMKAGGYDAASFIVGNGRIANVWTTIEQTLSMIKTFPQEVMLVHTSKDVIRAKEMKKVGILMSIEGIAKWIMGETDILRMLYRNGVKWVALSHGEGGPGPELEKTGNPLYKPLRIGPTYLQGTESPYTLCTPQQREAELRNAIGLTPFGIEVLKVSNELGIVTDLTHINDRAYFDVLERTNRPAVVSHSNVFSLCNHYRNLTDDQIKALAANNGVVGICFVRQFLAEDPHNATLELFVRHIAYVADLVGIDHVGIGTDFDGIKNPLLPEVSQLVKVTKTLMEYGFSNEEIKKIWGGNFLRILEQNIDKVA